MLKAAGLILNRQNEEAVRCAEKAAEILRQYGVRTFDPQTEKPDPEPDLILTFGGDGTLLIGARYALKYNIPLMGVNLGTVGFLTEEDPSHLEEALKSIRDGMFKIEERSLLIVKNKGTGDTYFALNDAVITRGGLTGETGAGKSIVVDSGNLILGGRADREQTAELQIDGQNMGSLKAGDEIHVTGTEKKIRLIRLHSYDFFGLVRTKLSEWGS